MIQFRIMAKCGSDTIILMCMNKLVSRVIESVERYWISGLKQLLSDCLLFVIRNEIFDYLIFKSYRQYFSHISAGAREGGGHKMGDRFCRCSVSQKV